MANDPHVELLLEQVRQGNAQALNDLFAEHRAFLRRLVDLRLDNRMRGRLDASDVVQETLAEAARRMPDYLERAPMPFRLWLRQTACQWLIDLQRKHLGAARRALQREQALPAASSLLLAQAALSGSLPPNRKLDAKETAAEVRAAVAELAEEDAEIILLRSFEDLSNQEAAQVLGIEPSAASKRYGRALLRLRRRLLERGLAE